MSKRLVTCLMAALVAVSVAVVPTRPASAALAAGVTHEAIFSNPTAYATKTDYKIHERMVKMVNETPPGSTIRHTAWNITYVRFADALINAHKRGVNVYVVQNGAKTTTQLTRIKSVLGSRHKICKKVVSTGVINGCLSGAVNSYMHSKVTTFSTTGTKKRVVTSGSTNMTNHGYEVNDMLIVAGDSTLYDGYVRYFNDMFNQRTNPNYMTSTNGVVRAPGSASVSYFSPRLTSTGTRGVEPSTSVTTQAATDPVVMALRRMTGGAGCSLKLAERYWNSERVHVTSQVVRIKKAGCSVIAISDDMDWKTRNQLVGAGVTLRKTLRDTVYAYDNKMHGKYFVMEGTIDGVAGAREVWQGSHNLVGSSLRYADDTLMQVKHGPTVSAYEAAFDRLYSTSYKHP